MEKVPFSYAYAYVTSGLHYLCLCLCYALPRAVLVTDSKGSSIKNVSRTISCMRL